MAYSSCARRLLNRPRAFSFNDFSGEYASYFSTGMGTQPTQMVREHNRVANTLDDAMSQITEFLAR